MTIWVKLGEDNNSGILCKIVTSRLVPCLFTVSFVHFRTQLSNCPDSYRHTSDPLAKRKGVQQNLCLHFVYFFDCSACIPNSQDKLIQCKTTAAEEITPLTYQYGRAPSLRPAPPPCTERDRQTDRQTPRIDFTLKLIYCFILQFKIGQD